MSVTQTLGHTQHLGQPYLPSPQERFLPPPRPSSNLSNSYHHNIPTRPPSNLSGRQLPFPSRPESGMSGGAYTAPSHSQSRGERAGASEYSHSLGLQYPQEDLRRTDSRSSHQQHQRTLPPPQQTTTSSRAPAAGTDMSSTQGNASGRDDSAERGRKRRQKSPVDWVKYFGGKPPTEIIEIHDDDSPAPPATIQRLRPPTTTGTATAQHVDKRRRVNGGSGEVPTYSETNTPYSHSNGTSTESLQATTAPTSLGSQASVGSRIDTTQTGQKRKRTTRTSDAERKKQETQHAGPKGYLAEYGEYVPPPKQYKKQKDVVVPAIHDVSC